MNPDVDSSPDRAVVSALRKLTHAVWALVAVIVAAALMYAFDTWLWAGPLRQQSARETLPSMSGRMPPMVTPMPGMRTMQERFYDLPLDKQIEGASVIALAKYEKDGDRLKCVLAEIFKHEPQTEFYYKVGDEHAHCSRWPKPNTEYGEGVVMFFVGNPADFRYSTSVYGGRLGGSEMPIDVLRAKIKAQAK